MHLHASDAALSFLFGTASTLRGMNRSWLRSANRNGVEFRRDLALIPCFVTLRRMLAIPTAILAKPFADRFVLVRMLHSHRGIATVPKQSQGVAGAYGFNEKTIPNPVVPPLVVVP